MTRFGAFIGAASVSEVSSRLSVEVGHPVTEHMVRSYVSGRRSPRLHVALALVRVSDGGLTLEDIVQHAKGVGNGAVTRDGRPVD
jgi:hypothetical protein